MYKDQYNQTYSTPKEDEKRSEIFIKNLKMITRHNDPLKRTVNRLKLELNKFASMDSQDFLKHHTGMKPGTNLNKTTNDKHVFDSHNITSTRRQTFPMFLDYRSRMNPVEYQGSCSSCYAFATLAAIEGTYAVKRNTRINLSKQQIIDCASVNRCQPWYIDQTFEYVKQHRGLTASQQYPYYGAQNMCRANIMSEGAITNYFKLNDQNEETMKTCLNVFGPITVAVGATDTWQFYRGGIIEQPFCSQAINHAVVIVGYGNEFGRDYWLVRNSWGSWWGEQGYFKIARNRNGMCGITSQAYIVTI